MCRQMRPLKLGKLLKHRQALVARTTLDNVKAMAVRKQVPHLRWSQAPPLPWRRPGRRILRTLYNIAYVCTCVCMYIISISTYIYIMYIYKIGCMIYVRNCTKMIQWYDLHLPVTSEIRSGTSLQKSWRGSWRPWWRRCNDEATDQGMWMGSCHGDITGISSKLYGNITGI